MHTRTSGSATHAIHRRGDRLGGFKSAVIKRIGELRRQPGTPVWQRNYFEQVVRNEKSLQGIRQYIVDNPARWEFDRENPLATRPEPKSAWLTA